MHGVRKLHGPSQNSLKNNAGQGKARKPKLNLATTPSKSTRPGQAGVDRHPTTTTVPTASGDFKGEVEGTSSPQGKSRKKQYLTSCFAAYAVISGIYFLVNLAFWIELLSYKMSYFVLPSTPFFTVVSDASGNMVKFLVGAFIHFMVAILAVSLLRGSTKVGGVLSKKYQSKLLAFLMALAIVGQIFLVWSSYSYFGGDPLVQNGLYSDAILPPIPDAKDVHCTNQNVGFQSLPKHVRKLIRVNTMWMKEVNCEGYKKHLNELWHSKGPCSHLRNQKIKKAESDCLQTLLLVYCFKAYLVLEVLGLIFIALLIYFYNWAVLRFNPNRFSILEPVDPQELEALEAAERLRRHAEAKSKPKVSISLSAVGSSDGIPKGKASRVQISSSSPTKVGGVPPPALKSARSAAAVGKKSTTDAKKGSA